jgi:hypothetical protein
MSIDLALTTSGALNAACRVFLNDLESLPDDAFDKCFGGKSRTVADIVHEVNLVNDHVGLTIRGEELFDWPKGWITAPESQRTKATVIEAFKKSSEMTMSMVAGFTPEDLEKPITNEHGESNVFHQCRQMTLHLWFHSGQLNFIQTLLGDDTWHW